MIYPPSCHRSFTTSSEHSKKKYESTIYREVTIGNRVFGESIYLNPHFNVARIYALEITQRKQTEAIHRSRLHLHQFSWTHSLNELLVETLDEVECLTGSAIGFYHLFDETRQATHLQAWSTRTTREHCRVEEMIMHYPLDRAGVWADCVRLRQPVIHNDYAGLASRRGLPPGHVPVVRELVVPVVRNEQVVAIMGVGNKATEYTEADVNTVALMADLAWDIAERKRAESELLASENRLQSLFNSMSEGVALHTIIADDRGEPVDYRIVDVNAAFERILGISRTECLGKPATEAYGVPSPPYFEEYLAVATSGTPRRMETSFAPMDKCFDISITPWGEGGFATIFTDITSIRETAQELRQAKEVAESSSLTKSRFLANMSHELRTPMNGVLGMIQLSLLGELSDNQRKYLETAIESGKGLVRILNDILDLTKAESGKLSIIHEPFDLRVSIMEVVKILALEAEHKGLVLTCTMAPDLPEVVSGDRLRLQQVLTNLIANAVKFTEQGSVKINVTVGKNGSGSIPIFFSVSDTGVGIPAEKQQFLFQPFSQVDDSPTRRFGGTGLGLVICKEIVEHLGGSITCSSEEGRGSEFSFVIPFEPTHPLMEPASSPQSPDDTPAFPPSSGSGQRAHRILVAEDDPVNRTTLQIMLKRSGFQPELAPNGLSAVEMWEQGEYDLIVMDVQMPVMNGIEATRAIREQERKRGDNHIPIVALTAHAYHEDVALCLDAGMDSYLAKPVDLTEFVEAISVILSKGGEQEQG